MEEAKVDVEDEKARSKIKSMGMPVAAKCLLLPNVLTALLPRVKPRAQW